MTSICVWGMHWRQTQWALERGLVGCRLPPRQQHGCRLLLPLWRASECTYQRQLQLFLIIHFHFCARSLWPQNTHSQHTHTHPPVHTQKTLNRISVFSPGKRLAGNSSWLWAWLGQTVCCKPKLWASSGDLDWDWNWAKPRPRWPVATWLWLFAYE